MITLEGKGLTRQIEVPVYGREVPMEVTVRIAPEGVYVRPKRSKQPEDFVSWKQVIKASGADWL